MSKRFTDTELWKKVWFMDLLPEEKLAWFYLKDHCDNVGVWDPNYRLAEFVIGQQINWEDFRGKCNGNIEVLENGKWFLTDFVSFQYGELSDTCKPHQAYLKLLRKHGIEGYPKGIHTLKEKEKEKEKEEEEEEERTRHWKTGKPVNSTRYERMCDEYGTTVVDDYIERAAAWADSKGKQYKDYAAAAENYLKKDGVKKHRKEKVVSGLKDWREGFGE